MTLEPRRYTILRMDGKAFHTFTKGMKKPFDGNLSDAMVDATEQLVEAIPGAVFGYTQSDEISILITDFAKPDTQQWFGGKIQKITSVAASMTTVFFNDSLHSSGVYQDFGLFDARVFTLKTPSDTVDYFRWRQSDAVRNGISAAGQTWFNHKELHGKNTVEVLQMLRQEHGIDYIDEYKAEHRLGVVSYRLTVPSTISYTHKVTGLVNEIDVDKTVITSEAAPSFANSTWLYNKIPQIPM